MPSFGKRTPLTREHFAEFERCYGKDPNGGSRRKDLGEEGRFRKFSREDIAKRGDNLDISWLRDESLESGEDLPEPAVIASEIMERLQVALDEVGELVLLLDDGEEE
jgi:type I restriction enzyme M protein